MRQAELEGPDHPEPAGGGHAVQLHATEREAKHAAGDHAQQHGDVVQEALGETGQGQDHRQDEQRHAQIERTAIVGRRALPAGRPVDADVHQGDADDQDDRAGDHRRKQPRDAADHGRRHQAENPGGDHRAIDQLQGGFLRRAGGLARRDHRHHRRDRGKGDAHHYRQADTDEGNAEGLDQGGDAAGQQVCADQQADLRPAQTQRPADDQRHGHSAGVHDQDVLQTQGRQLGRRQHLIDRINLDPVVGDDRHFGGVGHEVSVFPASPSGASEAYVEASVTTPSNDRPTLSAKSVRLPSLGQPPR